MTSHIAVSARLTALVLAAAAVFAFASTIRAQEEVVVLVNGEPITSLDIQQRSKFMELSTHKPPTRQEAIDSLIDQILELREAKRYDIVPTDDDVNAAYASVASHMGVDAQKLTQMLASGGASEATLKLQLRAQIAWTSLVRGRYKERLQVGEKDVDDAVKAEGGDDAQKADAFEYKMQPVVLVVPHGSAQGAIESRQKEAETLRAKVQTCDEANAYFKSLPNAAIREPVIKTSADIPEVLRKVLDDTPIGHLTPPEVTKQGVEMVALCARKPTTIDTPKKKEMRDKIYAKKYETTSKTYLQEIRGKAMIEYR